MYSFVIMGLNPRSPSDSKRWMNPYMSHAKHRGAVRVALGVADAAGEVGTVGLGVDVADPQDGRGAFTVLVTPSAALLIAVRITMTSSDPVGGLEPGDERCLRQGARAVGALPAPVYSGRRRRTSRVMVSMIATVLNRPVP